ncbi:hypothetical protein BaRGS_00015236, partial [Batillaria attramentaria]
MSTTIDNSTVLSVVSRDEGIVSLSLESSPLVTHSRAALALVCCQYARGPSLPPPNHGSGYMIDVVAMETPFRGHCAKSDTSPGRGKQPMGGGFRVTTQQPGECFASAVSSASTAPLRTARTLARCELGHRLCVSSSLVLRSVFRHL